MTEPNQLPGKTNPADPVLFAAHAEEREPRNWTPLIVGFVLVLVAVAAIALLGRLGKKEAPKSADPYSSNLAVEQVRLSQADNFVGATVTYIDLTVKNTGPRTVTGGLAQLVFRDTLGQSVQVETLPLRALITHSLTGQTEAADLGTSPFAPGETRTLRLTVEHISSQWNQAQPDIEFRGLRFQ